MKGIISTIEKRQGLKINCPEEVAYRNGWLTVEKLRDIAQPLRKIGYGEYLRNLIDVKVFSWGLLRQS
jgi:glucose-1-phosphate thymidylyltransferase